MKHILITNDDGIQAQGIRALTDALQGLGRLSVVAPDREKSAAGHSITVHAPIKLEQVEYSGADEAWSIDGTPSDCVKLGIQTLMDKTPDLVVSGINFGPNLGTDVLYSGTVSAAIEGIINGVPAIAFSLNTHQEPDFTYAKKFIRKLVGRLFTQGLSQETLLNVNIPNLPQEEIKGVTIAKLGIRQYDNVFEHRKDPRGRSYYWLGGQLATVENDDDSDVVAIGRGEVTVTPIHFDLTNYRLITELQKWGLEP
ncbi:MAG TPA: 5'/3'-nucleotidase SurE [Bacillota bacterium]|nr:5'/3'-nucleotidase SurE [Bacillota bacterium]